MVSSTSPCDDCTHADVCKYKAEVLAAYSSLEQQYYNMPEPADTNTRLMYYGATRNLLFSVHCKFYKGDRQNAWDDYG